jgi:hypothetical protein
MAENLAVEISELLSADERERVAIEGLLAQLSSRKPPLDMAHLQEMTASATIRLLVGRDDAVIVGMLTVGIMRLPSGLVAHIDDVVVDWAYRGQGIARCSRSPSAWLARPAPGTWTLLRARVVMRRTLSTSARVLRCATPTCTATRSDTGAVPANGQTATTYRLPLFAGALPSSSSRSVAISTRQLSSPGRASSMASLRAE